MKKQTSLSLLFLFMLNALCIYAQESTNLEIQKETIIQEEREALKNEVEAVNKQLENNEITAEDAKLKKEAAAEKHALNIENRIAILENETQLKERNISENSTVETDSHVISVIKYFPKKKRERVYDRRTYSDFVLAFGLNNVITEGESLENSQFKIVGSRFAELGWAWKTRVFQESNWLRIKYGVSFQLNGLKPVDNQYFVNNNGVTELETFPQDLKKSKFRVDNLVVPVHFEIGPSKKIESENYFRYSTRKHIKVGLGGYAGFKIGTRQKLKYNLDGNAEKDKIRHSYNTSNLVYGLSAYAGWGSAALYVKYDLNTLFKDNPVEQRNISLGVRFDMD